LTAFELFSRLETDQMFKCLCRMHICGLIDFMHILHTHPFNGPLTGTTPKR